MWAESKEFIAEIWADTRARAAVIVVLSWLASYLGEFIFRRTFMALASRTATDLDDKIVEAVRRPLFWSIFFIGVSWAASVHPPGMGWLVFGVIKTVAVILWTLAAISIGEAVLSAGSRRGKKHSLLQPSTQPVFDMVIKIILISGGFYGIFLAWDINVTAWLASAGIIGIAIGFAAQDTLANVIAGIVILADGPYRVGDFIVLEKDQMLRGKVTRIGLRSTRILTLDNVEITVPNADIGKSKIINEVGGPTVRQRIHALISVAYGSDIDQTIEVLQGCPEGMDGMSPGTTPEARFIGFGASGLDFKVFLWIHEPARRDVVLAELNKRIYNALNAAGIEIPYNKLDVYLKRPGPAADE
jgi:small-conductance mechanosensitive channel